MAASYDFGPAVTAAIKAIRYEGVSFEEAVGAAETDKNVKRFEQCLAAHGRLPPAALPPSIATPIVHATDAMRAHYAPPSGLPAIGCFTIVTGGVSIGKRVIVRGDGAVVSTAATGYFPSHYNVALVGYATLEDVRHWITYVAGLEDGYITRTPVKADFAPYARGVRRAQHPAPGRGNFDTVPFSSADDAQRLLVFDIENVTVDPTTNMHDIPEILDLVRAYLPLEVNDARLLVSPTTRHSRPLGGNLEVGLRILAIADRPVSDAELEKWTPEALGNIEINKPVSDPTAYEVARIAYTNRFCLDLETSRPCADPFAAVLWQILEGREYVAVPEFETAAAVVVKAKTGPFDGLEGDALLEAKAIHYFGVTAEKWQEAYRRYGVDAVDALELMVTKTNAEAEAEAEAALVAASARRRIRAKGERVPRTGSGPAFLSPHEALARIGDDKDGFWSPMNAAAKALWREDGKPINDQRETEIVGILQDAIRNAYAKPERETSGERTVEGYIDEAVMAVQARRPANDRDAYMPGGGFDQITGDETRAGLPTMSAAEISREGGAYFDAFMTLRGIVPPDCWGTPSNFSVFIDTVGEDHPADVAANLPKQDRRPNPDFGPLQGFDPHPHPESGSFAALQSSIAEIMSIKKGRGRWKLKLQRKVRQDDKKALIRVALDEAGFMMTDPALVLAMPTGTGKTHTVINRINRSTRPQVFAISSPFHTLAGQSADDIPGALHFHGMDQAGMCWNDKARHIAQIIGWTPEGFCNNCKGKASADARDLCNYWKQTEPASTAKVILHATGAKVMLHPYAGPLRNANIAYPKVLVVDDGGFEDWIVSEYVELTDFDEPLRHWEELKSLLKAPPSLADHGMVRDHNRLFDFAEAVRLDFQNNPSNEGVRMTVARAKRLRSLAPAPRVFERFKVRGENLTAAAQIAAETDRELAGRLEQLNGFCRRGQVFARALLNLKVAAPREAVAWNFLGGVDPLTDEPDDGGDPQGPPAWTRLTGFEAVQGFRFGHVMKGSGDHEQRIAALHFKTRGIRAKEWERTAVVHLDATASPEIMRNLYPGAIVYQPTVVEPATRRHVRTAAVGRATLTAGRGEWAYAWGAAMGRLVPTQVTIAKQLAPPLRAAHGVAMGDAKTDLPLPFEFATHGAVRGLNAASGFRVSLTLGRTLISAADAAAAATALTGEIIPEGELIQRPSTWTLQDGSGLAGVRYGHSEGGLADAIVATDQASVTQSDGRLRHGLRDAEHPATSHIVGDAVVTGLLVDSVLTERGELSKQTIIVDVLGLAVGELGLIPVGKFGARFWREVFGMNAEAWEDARRHALVAWPVTGESSFIKIESPIKGLSPVTGQSWPSQLDAAAKAAMDAARADPEVAVLRVAIDAQAVTVICMTQAAIDAVTRSGLSFVRLAAAQRDKAIRSRARGEAEAVVAEFALRPARGLAT